MSNKYSHKTAGKEFEAKAPYNFVPLPEKVFTISDDEEQKIRARLNDKYHSDRHTGYIDLEITTETPLYTRCAIPAEVWKNQDHLNGKPKVTSVPECQDFFHHGNPEIPIIPGSTLRGMTRALVEILSYSKIPFTNFPKQFFHRGVMDTSSMGKKYREKMLRKRGYLEFDYPSDQLKGGYLEIENEKYYIRPAFENYKTIVHIEEDTVKQLLKSTDQSFNYHHVYPVWLLPKPPSCPPRKSSELKLRMSYIDQITDISLTERPGFRRANLVITGKTDKKHLHCAIYEKNSEDRRIDIPLKLWQLYKEDLEIQRNEENTPRELKNDTPLFYLLDDQHKLVFFGPTMMFRLPYPNTILDFIPEDLRCGNKLDLAEAIFGQVEENKHLAGRVFFSDAVWKPKSDEQNPFLKEDSSDDGRRIPKILSSPKPTSFQLYLNQPEKDVQNESTLKSYYDKGETIIRGFKRYWHKKPNQKEIFEENYEIKNNEVFGKSKNGNDEGQKSSQHTIISPVKQGTKFISRIYFENLSKLELGALLSALSLPESKRHKLGMGKPLGLGTICIKPTLLLQERAPQHDKTGRYDKLFSNTEDWQTGNKERTAEIESFKDCFRQEIVNHVKTFQQTLEASTSLGEISRLKELFTMLEWDNAISDEEQISYLGLDTKEKQEEWRKRHVLPSPQKILKIPETKCLSAHESVERIRLSIKNLRGAGHVNQVDNIMKEIEAISEKNLKRDLASLLKTWLVNNKMWERPTHIAKKQRLEQILKDT